jgi:CheY-like chemotaxis protein
MENRPSGDWRRGHSRLFTVLAVDNDLAALRVLHLVLGGIGFVYLEARTADEAIQLAAGSVDPVDMFLVDADLPGMSSRDLTERIRSAWPSVKVLYMVSRPSSAAGLHPDDVLWKPLAASVVLDIVTQAWSHRDY